MRKILKILILLFLSLSLSACWDSKNLEDVLLVYGLGIDVSLENSENYFFTIGFPTVIEEAPEKKMEFSAEAPSLGKGKKNIQQKVYRSISYDNIRVVVFGEKAAEKGIMKHLDSMLREPLFRGTTRFAVVQDRAVDLLNMKAPVALLVSTFLYDSIQQNHEGTNVPICTIRNFSNQFYTKGIEPSMPFISYGANRNELNVGHIALFKGDKFIYRLTDEKSRAFMYLKGDINEGICNYTHKDESGEEVYLSINLKGGTSKVKTKLIGPDLHIYQEITIYSTLGECTAAESVLSQERIKEFEGIIMEQVKQDMQETLEILQKELKSDNIGYGRYVKVNHPEFFDSENWNEQFSEAKIHVTPIVKIRAIGIKS